MERNEAIDVVKRNYPHVTESGSQFETALRILIPELKESEDERIRKMLIGFFGKGAENNSSTNGISDKDILSWLEKQGGQKPVEWNEEDDQYLLVCKNALEKYEVSEKWDARIISHWLENKLKAHQNTWKPSEEQIKVLEFFIPYVTKLNVVLQKSKDTLLSLLTDLKKLREE